MVSRRNLVSTMTEKASSSKTIDEGAVEKPAAVSKPKYASLRRLFSMADRWDILLMIFGTVGACVRGTGSFITFIFFGKILASFGETSNLQADISARTSLPDTLLQIAYIYAGLSIAFLVGGFLELSCYLYTGERQAMKLRRLYMEAMLTQEVGYFETVGNTAEISNTLTESIGAIQSGLGEKMGHFIGFFWAAVASQLVGAYFCWQLALLMLVVVPAVFVTGGLYQRALFSVSTKSRQEYGKADRVVEETISQIRIVYSYVGETRAVAAFAEALKKCVKLGAKAGLSTGIGLGSAMTTVALTWALLLYVGGFLILSGHVRAANASITIMCVAYGGLNLSFAAPDLETFATARRLAYPLHQILNRQPAVRNSADAKPLDLYKVEGKLELQDIHFFYPSRPAATVFSNLSVTIAAGRSLAIVGESGSGKSTIISLLARFYDPIKGRILLDGQDIKNVTLQSLRSCIGLVGQEPALFATSIMENIHLGRPEATDEECFEAAKVANAHSFIGLLPDGYSTHVGDRGTQLSGGQKQRIAIARAVLKNPSILLLDEATSALDAESERVVQAALDSLMLGRTSVVVAHRLTTISNVDTIAVLAAGKVVEQGSVQELMSKGADGKFFQLKHNQDVKEPHNQNMQNDTKVNSPSYTPGLNSPSSEIFSPPHIMPEFSPSADRLSSASGTQLPQERYSAEAPTSPSPKDDSKGKDDTTPTLSTFGVLKLIARLTVPEWKRILLGWFGAISNGAFRPIVAFLVIRALLSFFNGDSMEAALKQVHVFCLILALYALWAALTATLEHSQLTVVGETVTKAIRERIFAATLRNEVGWYDRLENTSAMITGRLAVDGGAINKAVSSLTPSFIKNMSALLFALGIGLVLEWRMTLVNAAVIPMFIYSGVLRYKVHRGFAGIIRASNEEVTQLATESVSSIRTVYTFTMERRVCDRLASLSDGLIRKAANRAIRAGLINGTNAFLPMLAFCFCMLYIQAGLRNHTLKFANAFSVFQVISTASLSLWEIVIMLPALPNVVKSANNISTILNRKSEIDPEEKGSVQPKNLKGSIQLKQVEFRYPSRPTVLVLNNVDLEIKPGQIFAIVGESGSGKSSIIAMIERFYDPTRGKILIDNVDIKELNLKWLRRRIGFVQQEPALFNQTVRANILYGKEEASEAEIIEAAKAANAHTFISGLPQGYDTVVGERGTQLSGGQKQRVAIARAIVKNPSILLLDEATSALDTESEKVVQEALDKLLGTGTRTTLVVAHRLSTIQDANTIAVMSKGQIVEQGNHTSLLELKGGLYARLLATHKQ